MPELVTGSVVALVVPQGFLRSAESQRLRSTFLTEWSLSEISVFEDRLFDHSRQETAIIIGRKEPIQSSKHVLIYRRVRNSGMKAFKERQEFSSEAPVNQSRFAIGPSWNLELPELEQLWHYLRHNQKLGDTAAVIKGLEFDESSFHQQPAAESAKRISGFEEVVRRAAGDYGIHELPPTTWVDFSRIRIRRHGPSPKSGVPQVLVNYARAGCDRWKLRALLDVQGLVATRRFLVIRLKDPSIPLHYIWSVLNSPVANAYIASHASTRDLPKRHVLQLPLPIASKEQMEQIADVACEYLRAVSRTNAASWWSHEGVDPAASLLRLDAEVLRLYDVPPLLERELLDYFRGERRKGVPFVFPNYYPVDFLPCVPLHEYLSTEYARCTLGQFREAPRDVSPDVLAALRNAAEAHGEE